MGYMHNPRVGDNEILQVPKSLVIRPKDVTPFMKYVKPELHKLYPDKIETHDQFGQELPKPEELATPEEIDAFFADDPNNPYEQGLIPHDDDDI